MSIFRQSLAMKNQTSVSLVIILQYFHFYEEETGARVKCGLLLGFHNGIRLVYLLW